MRIDGVFSGGGLKGFALVGAYEVLEEKGYQFKRVAGTSAGAGASGSTSIHGTGRCSTTPCTTPSAASRGWPGGEGAHGQVGPLFRDRHSLGPE